ncbi:MAG: AI-2E family transporter [Clostridiaceae bacterium]
MEKLKMKNILIIITYTVFLFMALNHFTAVTGTLGKLFRIIVPFIYGIGIAFILNIPFQFFKEKVFAAGEKKDGKPRKWAKLSALLATYASVLITIFLIIWFIIPQLGSSVNQLILNIPYYLVSLQTIVNDLIDYFNLGNLLGTQVGSTWTNLLQQAATMLSNMLLGVFGYIMGLTSSIYNWMIGFIVSVYMLSDKENLQRQSKKVLEAFLPKKWMGTVMEVTGRTNYTFNRFIKGTLIDSTVVGVICFIGLSILGIPYVLLVSVIQGITNMIPIFGPFIGAALSAFIILMDNPFKVLIFLIFIIVLQQVDGNIIQPRIVGNAIGLPGMWVLFAVVVGSALFGILGLIIAVPTVAVLYSLLKEFVNKRLEKKESSREKAK